MADVLIARVRTLTPIAIFFLAALYANFASAQTQRILSPSSDERLVQLSVVVRDRDSNPVLGLTSDDFVVRDMGKRLLSIVTPVQLATATASSTLTPPTEIWTLIIIPPMSLESRHFAIRGALQYASGLPARGVRIAIADASGESLPFTSDRAAISNFLLRIQVRSLSSNYAHPLWFADVQSFLEEEASAPCVRSAVLFVDEPSVANGFMLIAKDTGVPLYLVDARGLTTTVPFGEAATEPGNETSVTVQSEIIRQQLNLLRHVANETGGQLWADNNDLSHIFQLVENDGKGSYLLKFYLTSSKFHRVTISSARPGLQVIVRPTFSKSLTTLTARDSDSPTLLPANLGNLPVALTPNVAFFPAYRNGLFLLAIRCKITIRDSNGTPIPTRARLKVDVLNDYEGSMGVIESRIAFTEPLERRDVFYDALAKVPAGSYTLSLTLVSESSSDSSAPNILGTRRYRFRIHPLPLDDLDCVMRTVFTDCHPDRPYLSSLALGQLVSGSAGTVDVLGIAPRADTVLLNNPLNIGGQHFEISASNELTNQSSFAAMVKLYASEKKRREIRDKWLKSATIETLAGEVVAGPFVPELPPEGLDGSLPILVRLSLASVGSQLHGQYQLRVSLKKSASAKSDKSLVITAPFSISDPPKSSGKQILTPASAASSSATAL